MLLKSADDKSCDIDALEALLRRSEADARQRHAIQNEIWSIRHGAKAEADAAYLIDFGLRDTKNSVVIHDLRIEVDGLTAQIDHLVVSRVLEVFVCESKSYTGGVKVNEYGEWVTFRAGRPVGIPSPVEQNRRHIQVLERAIKLGVVQLPRRIVAIKPTFMNIVLVSNEGSIGRPRKKLADLDHVMKADQFRTYLENRDVSSAQVLKIVSSDTLESFGRQLVALHSPVQFDWAKRFGLSPTPEREPIARPTEVAQPSPPAPWLVKYDGPCSRCGKVLVKGTPAVWRPGERRLHCLDCAAA